MALLSIAGCSTSGRAPLLNSEPERSPFGGGYQGGSSCEEGALRDCTEKAGERSGFVTCKRGLQECRRGVWSPCGEESVRFITRHMGLSDEQAPVCLDNPCNPECLGFDENHPTPIGNPLGPGFSFEGNPNEWGNAPGGFEGKQDCGRSGGCLGGYPKKCGGDPAHFNRFDGCQADHHCDAETDKCLRNEPGWTWPASTCPGVDLSVGPACYNGQNHGFPVCNRGNTAILAGTTIKVAIADGNDFDLSQCPPNLGKPTICSIKPSSPLRPGECIRLVHGPSCNWNGNAVAFANWDMAVPECGLPMANPRTNATQPGCSNNWSDVKTGAACQVFAEEAYEPLSWTEEYTAVCPFGTRPRWGVLLYDAVTPCSPGACDGSNASSVKFEMQTAPLSSPTSFGNWIKVAHAPAPPYTHPSSCTSSGPAPCPIGLGSMLANSEDEILQLRVTLTPSPDARAAASLSRWQISYDCGALE